MAERILLVEDEEKLARMVELELQYEGYEVEKAFDGRTGLELALSGKFDLVLLDIMLPALSGMEVLRRLRKESQMPVIMLTARDTVVDKVSGLDMGADDYITKPFAIEELLARIRAALRKRPAQAAEPPRSLLTAGPCPWTPTGTRSPWTARTWSSPGGSSICCATCWRTRRRSSPGSPLLDHVWGFDFVGETNAVDVYIRFLRSKIDEHFGIKLIHTVRGVGYVIREE